MQNHFSPYFIYFIHKLEFNLQLNCQMQEFYKNSLCSMVSNQ